MTRIETMKQVRAAIEINAPGERVWALIAEFRHWPRWGPTVRRVRSEFESVAPGATGSIQTPIGLWLPFEITGVANGESWSWKVGGVAATRHEVVALGSDRTRLEFSVPVLFFPYLAVLRVGLARIKDLAESETRR